MKTVTPNDILTNEDNFKQCKCNVMNWHENDKCFECGGTEFMPITQDARETTILLNMFGNYEMKL